MYVRSCACVNLCITSVMAPPYRKKFYVGPCLFASRLFSRFRVSEHMDSVDSRSCLDFSYWLNEGPSVTVVRRSTTVSLRGGVAVLLFHESSKKPLISNCY